ncbi:hypothetical protein AC579_2832 [Pseudocercospora musae]|uniref:Uncharacterized protein n=1 Tax=Pseudocercospora musae TaxID=113226 RepID=A0A139IKN2_9PEZI|nr:hypothetical protein AC579_2832 [Pseudocercospora musae]
MASAGAEYGTGYQHITSLAAQATGSNLAITMAMNGGAAFGSGEQGTATPSRTHRDRGFREEQNRRQKLLQWLQFPQMNTRRKNIHLDSRRQREG